MACHAGMENPNQDEEMTLDASVPKKTRKPRGPSKGLKSIPGVQRVIEWDEFGRPCGPWASDYKKHVGEISRSKVSILHKSWGEVPQGIKDALWEDTKVNTHDSFVHLIISYLWWSSLYKLKCY